VATARVIITLECQVCRERNYSSTKNKRANAEKLKLSKYCSRCRKHTEHKFPNPPALWLRLAKPACANACTPR
jgi:large subunit ribosomal protein L33